MKIALAILTMQRLGGKQRDCMSIAHHLMKRGCEVTLLSTRIGREMCHGIPSERVQVAALSNHGRMQALAAAVGRIKIERRLDAVIAFDPLPGCEFHYAAEEPLAKHSPRHKRWLARYRTLLKLEGGVFAPESKTKVFYLTENQRNQYWDIFGPAPDRAIVMPPHTDRVPSKHYVRRAQLRQELAVSDAVPLAISVAQNPVAWRKGLDRTLAAMAEIPDLHLLLVGCLDRKVMRQALAYGVSDRVRMLPYLEDVVEVMGAADFLAHPARLEAGGLVIVEALLAGIPAIATRICGYAGEVERSGAGFVIEEPFEQQSFVAAIRKTIAKQNELKTRARTYALAAQGRETWLARLGRELEQFCRIEGTGPRDDAATLLDPVPTLAAA